MIEYLRISNLALLEKAQLEFSAGFTVVTGETGAGKSVLLGALSMLAGNRCSKDVIRADAEDCRVEAILRLGDTSKIDNYLEENGIAKCEDKALLLSRIVHRQKPARAFVNGTPVSQSTLAGLGEYWIDFHGPGEPQKLFSAKNQLSMLDSFISETEFFEKYREILRERAEVLKQIENLKSAKRLGADEVEFLKEQIAAIDAVNPTKESIAELEEKSKMAEMASDIVEKSSAIYGLLCGDEGASDLIAAANRLAGEIERAGDTAANLARRLESLSVDLADIADDYETLAGTCDMDAESIDAVRAKMSAWLTLARKYGASAQMVMDARADMQERLDSQCDVKATLEKLHTQVESFERALIPLSEKIFNARKKAAKTLASAVEKTLPRLGFKSAAFDISLKKNEEFSTDCGSSCEFLFCPNPGQSMMGLSKIASSGELARVMLALKTTLAEADSTPVLVFDEVDANVGGEIGAEVGVQLAALGKRHQVLCVTHLPQVAACGSSHFLVEKTLTKNSTSVGITQIADNSDARVSELARMLGDRKSESAIAHAKKLLRGSSK